MAKKVKKEPKPPAAIQSPVPVQKSPEHLMTAVDLFNFVHNEHDPFQGIESCVQHMRRIVGNCAKKFARERAKWHDDPAKAGYEAAQAQPETQFPQQLQDDAIRQLVDYLLKEREAQKL